jgi:predicted transcriptional regulator
MAKTITLRVDDTVYDTLKRAADGDRRTISNFIEYATIHYILNNNIVDDAEMNEILSFEKDIKKGLNDIKHGRYKIVG